MVEAIQVAQWFVHKAAFEADANYGDYMTKLRVHKFLFLAQSVYLAEHEGEPLFQEEITHLPYGPVVTSLMSDLKEYSRDLIEDLKDDKGHSIDIDFGSQKDEINSTLARVYTAFNPCSTSELITMTQQNPAWMETKNKETISTASMYAAAKQLYFE